MPVKSNIETLLVEALDLDPAERGKLLDRRCGDDADLRQEIERRLAKLERSDAFFDRFADSLGKPPSDESRQIGSYRLLSLLGRGGMGAVYLAERIDGQYDQQVALKLLPGGAAAARNRFETERQILASLVHPNICRLLDGGVDEHGTPYFVMDYVDGLRIDDYCNANQLSIDSRLQLFLDVCDAVHYAHQQLVLHRDIKPGNILVDERGSPQLLDFGVAKLIGDSSAPGGEATVVPLTPAYASPESLQQQPSTTASDVYSLGVLLYRLVTGQAPYELADAPLSRVLEILSTSQPQRASRRIIDAESTEGNEIIGRALGMTVDQHAAIVRGDIDSILSKCLQPDPIDRYDSVKALAEDIRRYRSHRPVSASAPSWLDRSRKFVRRNTLPVSLGIAAAFALVALAAMAVKYALDTQQQSLAIVAERDRANAVSNFLVGLFEETNDSVLRGNTRVDARELVDQGVAKLESDSMLPPDTRASILESVGRVYGGLSAWPEAEGVALRELELRRSLHGEDSAEVARVLEQLSTLQDLTGDWAAAERSALRAMQIRTKLNDTSGIASSRHRLGRMRHLRGDYSEARPHYEAALEILQRELGEENQQTLDVLGALAALSMHEGQLETAEEMQRRLIEIRTRLFGELSQAVMENWLGLGQALMRQERFEEAKEALELAASINTRSGGDNFNSNAFVYNALGIVEIGRGDYPRAVQVLRDALKIWERLAENHPNSGYALESLGRAQLLMGEASAALDSFSRSLAVFENAGQQFSRLSVIRMRQAEALLELNDVARASTLADKSLPAISASFGDSHAHTRYALDVAQRIRAHSASL